MFGTSSITELPFASNVGDVSAAIYADDSTFGGGCFASVPLCTEFSLGLYYVPPIVLPPTTPPITSGGGGGSVQYYRDMPSARSRTWDAIEQVQNREKILREDEELMIIMKVIAICL